jgi:hypothetical protein
MSTHYWWQHLLPKSPKTLGAKLVHVSFDMTIQSLQLATTDSLPECEKIGETEHNAGNSLSTQNTTPCGMLDPESVTLSQAQLCLVMTALKELQAMASAESSTDRITISMILPRDSQEHFGSN